MKTVCACSKADLLSARIQNRLTIMERRKMRMLQDSGEWTYPELTNPSAAYKYAMLDEFADRYRQHISKLWNGVELPDWLAPPILVDWPTPSLDLSQRVQEFETVPT